MKNKLKFYRLFQTFGLFLGISTTLLVTFGGFWLFRLNKTIAEGFKNKNFLPATDFFSAPESISPHARLTQDEFETLLRLRKYEQKSWNEKLRPGEYSVAPEENCKTSSFTTLLPEAKSCFLFSMKETEDPENSLKGLQMLVFGGDKAEPIQALAGNPLVPSQSVSLEPILLAQYMGTEPVQQSYHSLGDFPIACLNSVLAIEDTRFLTHSGVSLVALARAALHLLQGRVEGGSTITQQLVKNYFLNSKKTLTRKMTEFFMSLLLETHSSKDEILETYLNIIYMGQKGPLQVIGFPAAAEYYFGKSIQNLNLSECALLAAVLNSPGIYNPFTQTSNALNRRNLVLNKMVENKFIEPKEGEEAKSVPLPTSVQLNIADTAPYYVDTAQKELLALSIPDEGVKVFTGLHLKLQQQAQKSVYEQLEKLEKGNKLVRQFKENGKNLEAVFASADNKTGLIQSIVGGRGYKSSQFNRVLESRRQIGSIMKPLVFLTALNSKNSQGEKYTPTASLPDRPFVHEYHGHKWSPKNYEKKYYGNVPMYFALKNSLNCATAWLGIGVGLDKIIKTARALGVQSPLLEVPSLTLGAFELTPKEVLQVYTNLANLGERKTLHTIRFVVDKSHEIIYSFAEKTNNSKYATSPDSTAQLVSMMKQTIRSGTAKSAYLQGITGPAAGKTGTTSDNKDSWFAGFTPQITAVAWVGYDDNTSSGLTGATGALPVWISFMQESMKSFVPAEDFPWPKNLIKTKVQSYDDHSSEVELLFTPN